MVKAGAAMGDDAFWRIALPGWAAIAATHGALVCLAQRFVVKDWPGIPHPPGLQAVP